MQRILRNRHILFLDTWGVGISQVNVICPHKCTYVSSKYDLVYKKYTIRCVSTSGYKTDHEVKNNLCLQLCVHIYACRSSVLCA